MITSNSNSISFNLISLKTYECEEKKLLLLICIAINGNVYDASAICFCRLVLERRAIGFALRICSRVLRVQI